MLESNRPLAIRRRLAMALIVVPLMTVPAMADSFQNSNNCMTGSAAAYDYAEYEEDFAAGDWKNHSGLQISQASKPIVLKVTDSYGNSICSNTANPTTECKFQAGFQSTFNIQLDNTQNNDPTSYVVCAF